MANLEEETKKARADRFAAAEALSKIKNDKFPQHIIDMVQGKTQHHARELYNDGWRCGGGIDQSGRRILFRGESHAYVSLHVWTEVERITKDFSSTDLMSKEETLAKMRQHGDGRGNAVVGEKGNETITVKTYEEYKKALKNLSDKQKDRTQVTELNEVPDTFGHSEDAVRYAAYGMDIGRGRDVTVISPVNLKWRKVRSRGSRFLQCVNPLGDTAMYTRMMYHSDIFGYRFGYMKFKKGGSRG